MLLLLEKHQQRRRPQSARQPPGTARVASSSGEKEKCSSSHLESVLIFSMFIDNIHSFVAYIPYIRYRAYLLVSTRIIISHFMLVNKMNILFVNIDDDGLGAYDCYMGRAMQREL